MISLLADYDPQLPLETAPMTRLPPNKHDKIWNRREISRFKDNSFVSLSRKTSTEIKTTEFLYHIYYIGNICVIHTYSVKMHVR